MIDIDDVADRAKHGYAVATGLLADTCYRLAELAGTGGLDPDESRRLQWQLVQVWEALCGATLSAVRADPDDFDSDDRYSNGSPVIVRIRIEPEEDSEGAWEHNRFCLGDGAVGQRPRGMIWHINQPPSGQIFRWDPDR